MILPLPTFSSAFVTFFSFTLSFFRFHFVYGVPTLWNAFPCKSAQPLEKGRHFPLIFMCQIGSTLVPIQTLISVLLQRYFVDVTNSYNQLTLSKGDYPLDRIIWMRLIQAVGRPEEQNWGFPEEGKNSPVDCNISSCPRVASLPFLMDCPRDSKLASPVPTTTWAHTLQ